MSRHALFAFVVLSFGTLNVSAMTLEEAIFQALHHYPTIISAEQNVQSREAALAQAEGGRLPKVGIESEDTYYFKRHHPRARAHGIVLRQILYAGGGISAGIREQQALLRKEQYTALQAREELILNAAGAYLGWYQAQQASTLALENLVIVQRITADVKTVSEADTGRRFDLAQAEVRLAKAQQELELKQANLQRHEARYQRLFGALPPLQAQLLDQYIERGLPPTLDAALAQMQNPQVISAQAGAEAARENVALARAHTRPRVELSLRSARGGSATVHLSWQAFDAVTRQGVSVATAKANAAQYEVEDARLLAVEKVRSTWAELQGASARLNPVKVQARLGAQVLAAYRDQFQIGRRTLLDLLNATDELYNNRLSALGAEVEFLLSRYRLVSALGKLSALYCGECPILPPEAIAKPIYFEYKKAPPETSQVVP